MANNHIWGLTYISYYPTPETAFKDKAELSKSEFIELCKHAYVHAYKGEASEDKLKNEAEQLAFRYDANFHDIDRDENYIVDNAEYKTFYDAVRKYDDGMEKKKTFWTNIPRFSDSEAFAASGQALHSFWKNPKRPPAMKK